MTTEALGDLHSSLITEKKNFFAAALQCMLRLDPFLRLTALHALQSLYDLRRMNNGCSVEQVVARMVHLFGLKSYACDSVEEMMDLIEGFGFITSSHDQYKTTEFGNQFVNWFFELSLLQEELVLFTERFYNRKPSLRLVTTQHSLNDA